MTTLLAVMPPLSVCTICHRSFKGSGFANHRLACERRQQQRQPEFIGARRSADLGDAPPTTNERRTEETPLGSRHAHASSLSPPPPEGKFSAD